MEARGAREKEGWDGRQRQDGQDRGRPRGRLVRHDVYKKIRRRRVTFKAHDEKNESGSGTRRDRETRPISKDKRWRVARADRAPRRAVTRKIPAEMMRLIRCKPLLDAPTTRVRSVYVASRCSAAAGAGTRVGDIIVVKASRRRSQRGKVKKGDVSQGGVVRPHRKGDRRPMAASSIRPRTPPFSSTPRASRSGPAWTRRRELRARKYMKIISLAPDVL